MANEPVVPAAEPKAAATGTPASPAATPAAAAPVTPAAPASVTPPAAAPAAPATGAKEVSSLLDSAKAPGTPQPVEALHDAAIKAVEAWQANPTADTKTAAEKAVADAKAGVEAAKAAVVKATVPEKYEIKPIEGVTFDQAAIEAFTPVAKKLGLSNDAVNELVALQANIAKTQSATQEAADLKLWTEHQTAQKEETIKTLGAKWEETLAFAATARDAFFSKEAVQALNNAGVANNIHILKAFIEMGKKISPEKLVDGQPVTEGKSVASNLYPSMNGAKAT